MPRCGYTSITVPVKLKDQLKEISLKRRYNSVPKMIEQWMLNRTGTVQVQQRVHAYNSVIDETIDSGDPYQKKNDVIENDKWCDCRDSNPGRLRGRLSEEIRGAVDRLKKEQDK